MTIKLWKGKSKAQIAFAIVVGREEGDENACCQFVN
jgi:hypothetical protein